MALLRRRVLRAASEAAAVRRSVKCGNNEQSPTSVGERQQPNTDLAHSTLDTITSRIKAQSWLSVVNLGTKSAILKNMWQVCSDCVINRFVCYMTYIILSNRQTEEGELLWFIRSESEKTSVRMWGRWCGHFTITTRVWWLPRCQHFYNVTWLMLSTQPFKENSVDYRGWCICVLECFFSFFLENIQKRFKLIYLMILNLNSVWYFKNSERLKKH